MEDLTIILLAIAFYWLMLETRWLTVRLPQAVIESKVLPESEALEAILAITPLIIAIGFIVSAINSGFLGLKGKLIINTEQAHGQFMASLWKLYGRKQPKTPLGI